MRVLMVFQPADVHQLSQKGCHAGMVNGMQFCRLHGDHLLHNYS